MIYIKKLELFEDIYRKNKDIKSFVISYLDSDKEKNKYDNVKLNKPAILKVKNDIGISFWQSALSKHHKQILNQKNLVSCLTNHIGPGNSRIEIHAKDIYVELKKLIETKSTSQSINIISRVILNNNSFGYIPIIDFRLKQSKTNLESVSNICKILESKFDLKIHHFRSSSSYHAYGNKILSHVEYFSFLGWALMFDPLVDGRHIAHQLIDGYGALRIA